MENRPLLDTELDSVTFRSYYYLKEEMIDFCRKMGLPTTGGKIELADIIVNFLDTGEKPCKISVVSKDKQVNIDEIITETRIIEPNFVCSEKHRAFFIQTIGNGFSFNVAFQKWLKTNAGKTYREAIEVYYKILEEKKNGKTTIDKQFEYNTYIRDFFADNEGKSLKEAIKCWTYKKGLKGHNRYEKSDLVALNNLTKQNQKI